MKKLLTVVIAVFFGMSWQEIYAQIPAEVTTLPMQSFEGQIQSLKSMLSTEKGIQGLKQDITEISRKTEAYYGNVEALGKLIAENEAECEASTALYNSQVSSLNVLQQLNYDACAKSVSESKRLFFGITMQLDFYLSQTEKLDAMLPDLDNSLSSLRLRKATTSAYTKANKACQALKSLYQNQVKTLLSDTEIMHMQKFKCVEK
jgi:hypothetical protein